MAAAISKGLLFGKTVEKGANKSKTILTGSL